jgi:hypothetical protein
MRERSRWSFSASRKRGQVILRHPKLSAYRCFLPDLAGFTGFCCTGPSPFIPHEPSEMERHLIRTEYVMCLSRRHNY